jgi:hypothetical protein
MTEAHRVAQIAIRAAFLREFMDQWHLLDPRDLDRTAVPWASSVMRLIAEFREDSAETAENYYKEFRAVELPTAKEPPPTVERRQSRRRVNSRGRDARPSRGGLRRVTIEWDDEDDAAETSLLVMGPSNIKAKRKRGKSPEEAAREALVEAGGSAGRHVLTGGRTTHLELVENDPEAIGWLRVTDGDPCAFCAMLSSRGPVYRSERSASTVVNPGRSRPVGAQYHDNCACSAEAMFSKSQAWPGRGREFQELWREVARGNKDGFKRFRRAIEGRDLETGKSIPAAG